jgi:hypothetical protein
MLKLGTGWAVNITNLGKICAFHLCHIANVESMSPICTEEMNNA